MTRVPAAQAASLVDAIEVVAATMRLEVAEAEDLLRYFRDGQFAEAGERMARMDRHHADLNSALSDLRGEVAGIQAQHFHRQTEIAASLRMLEYVIAGLILLTICGITTYGYKLSRQAARAIAVERERDMLRAEQMAAVAQLATGVAHELRNPLTSIKLLVQSNRDDAIRRGVPAEDLHIIEEEIRRMERSLQTFLDYARPPKPERRQLSLPDLIERTMALVELRARNQRVTLHYRPPVGELMIEADWEQIQQLLLNLALNALDAMPRGGTLEFDLRPPADGQLELRVLDSGPGIDPRVLRRLFEPFVTSKETGIGLGLVVSRRIAEDHGGSLTAGNRPEGGACFVLRLPALAEALAPSVAWP